MNDKVTERDPAARHESIPELLGQVAKSSAAVIRDEIELVIQHVREKSRAFSSRVLMVLSGVMLGFAALLSLRAALILWLTAYMSPVFAALVTGATLALDTDIIVSIGYRRLQKSIRNP